MVSKVLLQCLIKMADRYENDQSPFSFFGDTLKRFCADSSFVVVIRERAKDSLQKSRDLTDHKAILPAFYWPIDFYPVHCCLYFSWYAPHRLCKNAERSRSLGGVGGPNKKGLGCSSDI